MGPRMGADDEHITCQWCGSSDGLVGTEMCNRCWELDQRIGRDPELAEKILKSKQLTKRE